jgi:hypothetical protein
MASFTKTLMLVSVSLLTLSACSGDTEGPGTIGSKNDIVVHNKGMPGAQQQAATGDASQITSTVENVEPMPPADVAAGEPVPAPEGQEPLPSDDPAVEAAAQKVEEARAPLPSTTAEPMSEGTTASPAPATETTPVTEVAPEAVDNQTPPSLEGTATPEEKSAGAPVTQPRVYPAQDYPAQPPVTPTTEVQQPAANPSTVADAPTPAPTLAEPAKPGTKGTAYELGVTGTTTTTAPATDPAPVAPSGAVNPYDPAIIKAAQSAMKAKGGYSGAENGELSSEFLNALSKYQSDNKLTPGGINVETLRHLGVVE